MLQILYSSGGLFATKMGLKPLLISELFQNFQHFMVCMDIFLTNLRIFCRDGRFCTFDIFSEKAQQNFIKTRGGGQLPFIRFIKKQAFFLGGFPYNCIFRDNEFAHVTLACENGHQIEAHKVILAASCPFSRTCSKGTDTHTH